MTEQKFTELEMRWMDAWKNKDEAAARKIVSDDFQLASSLTIGFLVDKETWIYRAMNHYHCFEYKINQLKARIYGDTAVLNIWFYQKASANGQDWTGDFLFTDVWVKQPKWKVVSRHVTWIKN